MVQFESIDGHYQIQNSIRILDSYFIKFYLYQFQGLQDSSHRSHIFKDSLVFDRGDLP